MSTTTTAVEPQFVLLGSIIVWETLYRLCSVALRNGGLAEKMTLDPATIPILRSQGPSYMVSIVHGVLLGTLGIKHLHDFLSLSSSQPMLQYSLPPTTTTTSSLDIYESLECSNIIFVGYLLYDLYHVVQLYPKLGGVDMILHHLLFLTCSTITGHYQILHLPFGWLILGEISTTLLSLRWLLIKTGRGHTSIFKYIQLLFAIAFLVIRVIIYNMGIFHLIWNTSTVLTQLPVPSFFLGIVLLLLGSGSVLNLFWAHKICKMAVSSSSSSSSSANADNSDKQKKV